MQGIPCIKGRVWSTQDELAYVYLNLKVLVHFDTNLQIFCPLINVAVLLLTAYSQSMYLLQ